MAAAAGTLAAFVAANNDDQIGLICNATGQGGMLTDNWHVIHQVAGGGLTVEDTGIGEGEAFDFEVALFASNATVRIAGNPVYTRSTLTSSSPPTAEAIFVSDEVVVMPFNHLYAGCQNVSS